MTRIVRYKSKTKKSAIPTEEEDQIKLVVWLKKVGVPVAATGNGGSRNFFEAVKLKRMGVSKGYPDIIIDLPNKHYHGLRIELKRVSGGVKSPYQIEWQEVLRKNGYCCEFANGLEEAKAIVLNYLEGVHALV